MQSVGYGGNLLSFQSHPRYTQESEDGLCVQSVHYTALSPCFPETKWWIHFQRFQILPRKIVNSSAILWSNPLMLFFYRNTNPHFFQMRFHESAFFLKEKKSEFKNWAEHCCIDNSVTTNFFFPVCISSILLSSYSVAALQKEYEIFIRASCVEGTISTW